MMAEIVIRTVRPEDIRQAAEMERACFAEPWSERSLAELLKDPLILFLGAWKAVTREEICPGRKPGPGQPEILAGSCLVRTVLDEGEIFRIAVREDCRRQGFASRLLEEVWLRRPDIAVWNLEVRAGNASAIALYRKYGFLPTGKRKDYYSTPREDALLMQRKAKAVTPG